MTAYIIRRLMHSALVVLLVSMIVFGLIRLLPGDPVQSLIASGEMQTFSLEQVQELKHELGMDKPLIQQYFTWITNAATGNLGRSIIQKYDVKQEIAKRLPITFYLGILAFIIGIIIGPFLGVISAVRRGTWLDTFVTVIANIGITAPPFWVGIILIYYFGLYLKILPVIGYTSPLVDLGMNLQQSIMPVFVLSLFPIASAARQTRSSVIEVMRQDYIRTAWAKGLSERVIIMRHVLKNALMPVVTLQGMLLRNVIGGSVIVETVFFIPGMGTMIVNGMLAQDYPIVQGSILVIAIAVVISNLIVDLLYGWLDPRIQYE